MSDFFTKSCVRDSTNNPKGLNFSEKYCSGLLIAFIDPLVVFGFKGFEMKKFYRVFSGLAVTVLLALGSVQASAGPVYEFSFGSVSGQIFGLQEGVPVASSIIVDSSPFTTAPVIFETEISSAVENIFQVTEGQITSADFYGFDDTGLFELSLCFSEDCSVFAIFGNDGYFASQNSFDFGEPVFTSVPSPGSLALLALGLVAAGFRRRA